MVLDILRNTEATRHGHLRTDHRDMMKIRLLVGKQKHWHSMMRSPNWRHARRLRHTHTPGRRDGRLSFSSPSGTFGRSQPYQRRNKGARQNRRKTRSPLLRVRPKTKIHVVIFSPIIWTTGRCVVTLGSE